MTPAAPLPQGVPVLPTWRVNLMRVGYAFMAIGLVAVKWPLLPEASTLPAYEGVVAALLTGVSLLAILGLWHPVRMLPILVFEVAWKLVWLGFVAVPHRMAGDMPAEIRSLLFSVSFVVVILAVTPWDHVWKTCFRGPGDRWR